MTKAAVIEVFLWSEKNESTLAGTNRLVKDRSQKSGSIKKEASLTKLAPGVTNHSLQFTSRDDCTLLTC